MCPVHAIKEQLHTISRKKPAPPIARGSDFSTEVLQAKTGKGSSTCPDRLRVCPGRKALGSLMAMM